MIDPTRFDRDPEALAWARAKVQEAIDKAERAANSKTVNPEDRDVWRRTAFFMGHELLTREHAVHGAFDERWPAYLAAVNATEGPAMTPSIGQIVHYVSYRTPGGKYIPQCQDAIITEVTPLEGEDAAQADIENWDDDQRFHVSLAVLNPPELFFKRFQDEAHKRGGTWHWPDEPVGVGSPGVLRHAETEPDCPHCPDGHTPPTRGSQPWHARVGPERDGDGQPTTIHVARSGGAHVAESDAQWIYDRLNGATA